MHELTNPYIKDPLYIHRQTFQVLGDTGEGFPYARYINPAGLNTTALTTITHGANTLTAIPFLMGVDSIIETIHARVTTTQASQNYRLGIYTNKKVGIDYPDILLFDTGSISTGSGVVSSTVCNVAVAKNILYWLAFVCSSTTAVFRANKVGSMYPILGIDTSMGTALGVGYTVSYTYGALPYNFTSGATALTTNNVTIVFKANFQAR